MTASIPGTWGVALRLARLSIRRRLNRFAARRHKRRRAKGRQAVGRVQGGPSPALVLFSLLMLVQAFVLSFAILRAHVTAIEVRAVSVEDAEARTADWPAPEREGILFASLGVVLTVVFFALFFLHLSTGNPDLGQAGWDLEWLFTFPVPSRGLFLAKIGEFVFADLFGWAAFPPFLIVFLWRAGYGAWGIPLGLAAALCLIAILASLRLVAETWMRKRLSRGALKNAQAIASVLGVLSFFAVFLIGMQPPDALFDVAARVPTALLALPWTAPLLLGASPLVGLLVAGWALAAVWGALALASSLVRDGLLVSGGSGYGSTRTDASLPTRPERGSRLRGIAGKEIRLLLRDHNLLVQMLVIPLLVVGFQVFVNPALRDAGTSPRTAVVTAYAIGAYVLMFGAFSVLHVERDALWLLFTFPHRLGDLLRRKVVLWASVALVYTIGGLALAWRPVPPIGFEDALLPLFGMLAIPVLASIGAGLGTLGTDPFEQDPRRRVAPQWIYLYALLAGGYGLSLATAGLWPAQRQSHLCIDVNNTCACAA